MYLRKKKIIFSIFIIVIFLYILLLIPEKEFVLPQAAGTNQFAWNQDELWDSLEEQFIQAKALEKDELKTRIDISSAELERRIDRIAIEQLGPESGIFDELEERLFRLASLVGAAKDRLSGYIGLFTRMRYEVKKQSQAWDMNSRTARHRIYRLLYGGRAAVEEVMLQAPPESVKPLVKDHDEPSETPYASILGVTLHSGDILVSRGGAPTSALIARGNDYPGNFSHVALVQVDEKLHLPSIIESHIEEGVVINSLEDYLRDTKLRVMILRLCSNLSHLKENPMLPHHAASYELGEARSRHIPYDFEMDFNDPAKQFCSEVASAAYKQFGISLWMGISNISSAGTKAWLASLGVRHFTTQEPSDLEYDPQLQVVAEWRDLETLYMDHIDNAVLDAMLEGAEKGDRLTYSWYLLPLSRIIKGYSMILNLFGKTGPIPEGMSATTALRVRDFSRMHGTIKERVLIAAEKFKERNGYIPPYWEMVKMARNAKEEI
ncbi:MAG: YiiX/YebB-like N1pC/P60 family cysteine hydrolase [bacterium]